MEDETKVVEEGTEANVADILLDYKNNYVPKEEYDKLKKEHTDVIRKVLNGEDVESMPTDRKSLQEREAELMDIALHPQRYNDTDYMESILDLREVMMALGKPDPMLPLGKKITPTEEDKAAVERYVNYHRNALDYADGDDSIYINETQRGMIDTSPMAGRKGRR